jgi:glycine oxidase
MRSGRPTWEDLLTGVEAAGLDPGVAPDFDRRPDVLVVGGGIVGVATAVMCVRAGLGRVTVVEQNSLGAGASGGAAGLLIPDAHHGIDPPPFVALGLASLAAWRQLEASWPGGVGLVPLDWLGLEPLVAEFAAHLPPTARRLDAVEVHELVPDLAGPRPGVLLADQARVNPLRALARLAAGLAADGGAILTRVEVLDVALRGERLVEVTTSIGELSPGAVVFATGGPPELPHLPFHVAGQMVKGHMLATEPVGFRVPGTVAPLATQLEDGRLLSGGTLDVDDSKLEVRSEVVSEIRSLLDAGFPVLRDVPTSHRWCCFRPAVADRLPLIDRVPGLVNAWVTCGHFRTGILMAPATGQLLAKWIADGDSPPEARPFRIERSSLRGTGPLSGAR